MNEKTSQPQWKKYKDYQSIKTKHFEITLEKRAHYCDRGNWLAKIFEINYEFLIDDQDGWPRYYFDEIRAKEEIEAWLLKRREF